jgi:hypothetical protein
MNVILADSMWLDYTVQGRVHPITTMFALLLPSLLLAGILHRAGGWPRIAAMRRCIAIVAGLMVCLYLGAAVVYLFSHVFTDHVEPSIASISWLFWKGGPLYHDLATQERYSIPYGPYMYMAIGWSEGLLGPSIFASKLPGVLSGLLSLFFLFLAIRRYSTPARALCGTGLAAALMLIYASVSFWDHPDPFMLLAVALGLYATTFRTLAGPILLGLSLGAAVNLKADAFLYFPPAFVLVLRQKWPFKRILGGMAAAAVTTILPFVAFRNISFPNFLALLKINSERAFEWSLFSQILHWFAFLFLPIIIVGAVAWTQDAGKFMQFIKSERAYLGSILLVYLLKWLPASLSGAGTHHLLPLVLIIAFFTAFLPAFIRIGATPPRLATVAVMVIACAWGGACVIEAAAGAYRVLQPSITGDAGAERREDDLKRLVREHPDQTILSGVGSLEDYPGTFSRYILAFAGMPLGVEPNVMMDFEVTGHGRLDFAALVKGIEQERNKPVLFAVPKHSRPFSMRSYLPHHVQPANGRTPPVLSYEPLFADSFRSAFDRMFILSGSTEFFDVYTSAVDDKRALTRALDGVPPRDSLYSPVSKNTVAGAR